MNDTSYAVYILLMYIFTYCSRLVTSGGLRDSEEPPILGDFWLELS